LNDGNDWLHAGLTSSVVTTFSINKNNELFAGTEEDGLFRSTNAGATWQYLGFSGQTISCLTVNDTGNIFVGSYGGVHRSTDNGATWNYIQFSSAYVNAILSKGNNHLYAGTFAGVYSSSNGGATWTAMSNTGLRQTTILSLAFDENNNLIAGTYQGGLYRTEQSITDVASDEEIPSSIELFQNYPNPFNPTTNFGFRIANFGLVTLKVYNLLGQEVAIILKEKSLAAGEYTFVWNADENPSGVYLARLEIMPNASAIQSKSIQTKKILLMR
jgi:hypothetical protein